MSEKQLTLFVPGLLNSLACDRQTLPRFIALETLLAKAQRRVLAGKSYYQTLQALFGQSVDPDEGIPVAAISRLAECGEMDERIWMHVDPVYIYADKDRLVMRGNAILDMNEEEAAALQKELNNLYADDDYNFEFFHHQRWYVSMPVMPLARFHSLCDVLGRSVEAYMPSGKEKAKWHRFINEVQMLFHASEVNQQRNVSEQPPINSIWCWGVGCLPKTIDPAWQSVYTNEVFAKGLSMLSETPCYDLPANADEVLSGQSDQQLVVVELKEEDVLSIDFERYITRLSLMEQNWFKPLLSAIKAGRLARLKLIIGDGYEYTINRTALLQFWKRAKPLQGRAS